MSGYLVLALFPMLCVTGYNYIRTREILLEESYKNTRQEAERIEKNFSMVIEPYETIMDLLYVDQMLNGYLLEDYENTSYEDMFYYIDKKIGNIRVTNTGIKNIWFYSENDTLPEDNYYFYPMNHLGASERKRIKEAAGETILTGEGKNGNLYLERQLDFFSHGSMEQAMCMEIDGKGIRELLETDNKKDEIYLVGRDGKILACSNEELNGGQIQEQIPDWEKVRENQLEFTRNGDDKLTNIQQGDFGTKIIVISDKNDVLKNAKKTSRRMFQLIFFSAVLALTGILLYTRWISQRVYQVVYAAKRFGKGEFDYHLEDMGKDEIGEIGEAFNQLSTQIQELIQENYEKKISIQTSELNMLQEQINPHFLYNALSVISALAMREGGKNTMQAVKYLADFYRISLNKGKQILTVREEIELLQSYLRIQQMRFGEEIEVTYRIDEKILQCSTIKLILQPLVENAIHHGRKEEETLHIQVQGKENEDKLLFVVEDDGRGIEPEKLRELRKSLSVSEAGYGLRNVHNRVQLSYGENYGVTVENRSGGGTVAKVTIPKYFS